MTKLPLRFRILHFFSQVPESDISGVMEALRTDYGREGQFRESIFTEHLMSMRSAGLIEERDVSFDSRGKLVQSFAITDFGRNRLNYLPKGWSAGTDAQPLDCRAGGRGSGE